jgi:hypothetical protein
LINHNNISRQNLGIFAFPQTKKGIGIHESNFDVPVFAFSRMQYFFLIGKPPKSAGLQNCTR